MVATALLATARHMVKVVGVDTVLVMLVLLTVLGKSLTTMDRIRPSGKEHQQWILPL